MTSRERVRRAVLFEGPDRIPTELPDPWGRDILRVAIDPPPGWEPATEGEDEWGCVWRKVAGDKTMGQVTGHPLTDYSLLKDFRFPDFDLPERYATARKAIENNGDDRFVLACVPSFSLIHRLEFLRGHEEAWTDPYVHPDELGRLLDKLADIAIDSVRQFAAIGADGIFSCDDWGLQDRPMVSPKLFQAFWKPRYARVYAESHRLGMLNFLHSCGHTMELLEDFIAMGVDVVNIEQQENMGVEELGRRFGGRLCFWCPVDIQKTMVYGSPEDVRAYVRMLIDSFGRSNGGFIAKWYEDPPSCNHPQENVDAMADEFVKYGVY